MRKIKLKPKILLLIFAIILVIAIILIQVRKPNVGKIVDGKIEYNEKVSNVTKYKDKILIEFNNNYDLIDNCIISTELYNDFKNNKTDMYKKTLGEYKKLSTLSAKESYNIHKALDLKIVTEKTIYSDYFAKTCGFNNRKELLKYTEAVFDLANKEK